MIYSLSNSLTRASLNLGGFKLSGAARRIQLCRSKWQYGACVLRNPLATLLKRSPLKWVALTSWMETSEKWHIKEGNAPIPSPHPQTTVSTREMHHSVWLFSTLAHTQPSKHPSLPFNQTLLHLTVCCAMHTYSHLLHLVSAEDKKNLKFSLLALQKRLKLASS